MARRLPLDDGGAFYHPRRPLGFHPALRGAALLLRAGERRVPGLRESLRRTCGAGPPVDLAAVAAPSVWLDPERGFRVARGLHTRAARRRLRARLEPAERLAAWARERHLASPWVVELLLLTAAAWRELEPRRGAASTPGERTRPTAGWGPWVEALTRPAEAADATPLLELSDLPTLPYLRRLPHPAPGARLTLDLAGWRVETETWEDAEARLRRRLETELRRHRDAARRRAARTGLRPSPTITAGHHFDWLALRQVAGWTPVRLARRFRVRRRAVYRGLRRASELLELPLRPVRRGPADD